MALIGVLVALAAAMVGGECNELTRAMIDQTQASALSATASTKYRLVMLELEKRRDAGGIRSVQRGSEVYAQLRQRHAESNEDVDILEFLDPGGKIRAVIH